MIVSRFLFLKRVYQCGVLVCSPVYEPAASISVSREGTRLSPLLTVDGVYFSDEYCRVLNSLDEDLYKVYSSSGGSYVLERNSRLKITKGRVLDCKFIEFDDAKFRHITVYDISGNIIVEKDCLDVGGLTMHAAHFLWDGFLVVTDKLDGKDSATVWRVWDESGALLATQETHTESVVAKELRDFILLPKCWDEHGIHHRIFSKKARKLEGEVNFPFFQTLVLPTGLDVVFGQGGLHVVEALSPLRLRQFHAFDEADDPQIFKKAQLWMDGHTFYATSIDGRVIYCFTMNCEFVGKVELPGDWCVDSVLRLDEVYWCGLNILPLVRKGTQFDRGYIFWESGKFLDDDLLWQEKLDYVNVERLPSKKKGKVYYRITVRDASLNKAVHLGAMEVVHLVETICSQFMADNQSTRDRSFDGSIQVVVQAPGQPEEFEKDYIPAVVKELRSGLYFSPAGSRSALSVEVEFAAMPAH